MNKGGAIKALTIIHKAMLVGQILFAAVCVYIVYAKIEVSPLKELDRILQVLAVVLAAGGFFAGTSLFKKKLLQARDLPTDTKEKFALYRTACIIQWALIEFPCLFCIICFFLTGNYAFIALAAVLILLFGMLAPAKAKIIFQLGISEDELNEL
ncbi:hypothetical protein [Ferruginibacter sp. SUN106]|uniref:hypothetical protein n=1 Tax=Ferruginibacter sp. SUN106 TaxID=2978348 RepID=UPI003D36A1D9